MCVRRTRFGKSANRMRCTRLSRTCSRTGRRLRVGRDCWPSRRRWSAYTNAFSKGAFPTTCLHAACAVTCASDVVRWWVLACEQQPARKVWAWAKASEKQEQQRYGAWVSFRVSRVTACHSPVPSPPVSRAPAAHVDIVTLERDLRNAVMRSHRDPKLYSTLRGGLRECMRERAMSQDQATLHRPSTGRSRSRTHHRR